MPHAAYKTTAPSNATRNKISMYSFISLATYRFPMQGLRRRKAIATKTKCLEESFFYLCFLDVRVDVLLEIAHRVGCLSHAILGTGERERIHREGIASLDPAAAGMT
jgi:hypothetical protein